MLSLLKPLTPPYQSRIVNIGCALLAYVEILTNTKHTTSPALSTSILKTTLVNIHLCYHKTYKKFKRRPKILFI